MKYKSGIDWNEFLSKIDLVNNDEPIVIKNFLPSPEKLLSWEDVENVLNFRRFRWEIFNGSSKVELPQEQNNYLPPYYSKNVLQSYIKEGKTFIIINYSYSSDYVVLRYCDYVHSRLLHYNSHELLVHYVCKGWRCSRVAVRLLRSTRVCKYV